MAATDVRPLAAGERAIAATIFGAALDPEPVRLHRAKWFRWQPARVTMAPDGDIWFHPDSGLWCDDFAAAPLPCRALFVHELTHVWQVQSGLNLLVRRLPFARYRYRLRAGKPLTAYGIEQQASIVEHAYRARELGRPDPALEAVLPFAQAISGRSLVAS